MVALVMALVGTAAALPGKNKVDRNDIKKGAVRAKQIAKNAVKSKHIPGGAIKGDDIDVASLGRVPAVEGFDIIPLVKADPSAANADQNAAQASATEIPLFSKGAMSVYAKCFKSTNNPANPGMHAAIFLEAGPGAVFESGAGNSSDGEYSPFWLAQGENFIEGSLFAGTKVGSPEDGDGVFGPGDGCIFGGSVRSD
jgi:hypothetical protein